MRHPHLTPYFAELDARVRALGGYFNAHLHLDRGATFHSTTRMLADAGVADGSRLTIAAKHAVIPAVHASAEYDPDQLLARVAPLVEAMVALGTRRADSVVDVTADRVGLTALRTLAKLRARHAGQIDFRLGAYSPLGFRDDEPRRWSLLQEGAAEADFIGLLPERDDLRDYPDHIGFLPCCRRAIALAHGLGKEIHIHVDQANHPGEGATEDIAALVAEMGLARQPDTEPFIWLVHVISPSAYDEARFQALVARLAGLPVGVISCPSGALSMRQYRALSAPTHNSIARVLELLQAGVPVRIGSDNVCDITMPMGTVDLLDEVFVLGNALRFYDLGIMAKIAAGVPLDAADRALIAAHLAEDQAACAAGIARHQPLPGAEPAVLP